MEAFLFTSFSSRWFPPRGFSLKEMLIPLSLNGWVELSNRDGTSTLLAFLKDSFLIIFFKSSCQYFFWTLSFGHTILEVEIERRMLEESLSLNGLMA